MKNKLLKKWFAAGLTLLIQLTPVPAFCDLGLTTRFVDVTLEFVEVGKIYNLRQLRKIPYTITNQSSIPIEILVTVQAPASKYVRQGYEPIPDPSWIQILPNKFKLEPKSSGYAELILSVPDDKEYIGKHYHAHIIAQSGNTGMFQVGVTSDLRFSTGPGPDTIAKRKKKQQMMTLDFDITPNSQFVTEEVEAGKKFEPNKLSRKKLKVTNRADSDLKLRFISISAEGQPNIPSGYEPAPDPSWLKFKKSELKIRPDKIVDVEPVIEIPDDKAHYGKKYVFAFRTEVLLGIELELVNKIFVKVKDKNEAKSKE